MKKIWAFLSRKLLLRKKHNHLSQTIKDVYLNFESRRKENIGNVNHEWLNLGYWEHTNFVDKACETMVKKVSEEVSFKNDDVILDAGFGYGVQDIYWAKMFDTIKIHGLNIVDEQVKYAKELIKKNNLFDRVFLKKCDVVKSGFPDGYFDKVVAVESAMHFNTREEFLKEAYRVLKYGGEICLTDCLPSNSIDDNIKEICSKQGIPTENLYGIDEYMDILLKVGFTEVYFQDISEWVYPFSMASYEDIKNRGSKSPVIVHDKAIKLKEWREHYYPKTGLYYYYIIKAKKNERP